MTDTANKVDLTLYYEAQTPNAIRVADCMQPAVWLPKSQIKFEIDQPTLGMVKLTVPEWLAKEKGLI